MLSGTKTGPSVDSIPKSVESDSSSIVVEVRPVNAEASKTTQDGEQESTRFDLEGLRQATIVACLVILARTQ